MATGLRREDRRATIRASWFAVVLVTAASCAGKPDGQGYPATAASNPEPGMLPRRSK